MTHVKRTGGRLRLETAKVVHVRADEPLHDVTVEPGYRDVLLAVEAGGEIVGQVLVPAAERLPAALVASLVEERLGDRLWRSRLEALARPKPQRRPAPRPTVSVAICTRDRPEQLRRALESLMGLRTRPNEIIVVDNCPSTDATRLLCAEYPVRYVLEPTAGHSRARNRAVIEARSELLAFTDDDCAVDPRWLDGLGDTFGDVLVAASVGYFGPRDLSTTSQYRFELDRGFDRPIGSRVVDDRQGSPVTLATGLGAGGNMIFRRRSLAKIGMFAEDLGRGTPACAAEDTYAFYRVLAAGERIAVEPRRIVWHDHRATDAALDRVIYDDAVAISAYATRCLLGHHEPSALRLWSWCLLRRFPRDVARHLLRDERRLPMHLVLRQLAGTFAGPWRLLRSRAARRTIPPLASSPDDAPRRPALAVAEESPPLSLVVPSHNRSVLLRTLLDSLNGQTVAPERFEVVVVLDGATDGSGEALRSLALRYPLQVVEQPRRGAAGARNRGAAEARHPVVVFLDDDIVPDPGFLAAHAAAHRAAREPVVALGYSVPALAGTTLWERDLRTWWEDHHLRKAEPGHIWTFTDLAVGNSSFPRELFLEHRLDEGFADRGREDWELGVRLLAAGVPLVYRPDARGAHHLDARFTTALRLRTVEARADVHLAELHPATTRQLVLSLVADALASEDLGLRLAYRHAQRLAEHAHPLLPLLYALETLQLRRRWRQLADALMGQCYLAGLSERFASPEALLEFVAAAKGDGDSAVPLELAGPGASLRFPGGGTELSLRWLGAPVGRLTPLAPNEQWDWRAVAGRMVDAAAEDIRERAALRQLLGDSVSVAGEELVRAD